MRYAYNLDLVVLKISVCCCFIFSEAKLDMRKEYCTETDDGRTQPVESCDIDEISTAKAWTYVIYILELC